MAVRIGLLGVGFIGEIHAQAYRALQQARLVAVADARAESADRVAKSFGARAYYDIEALLADEEVEAVDICLPTSLHERSVVSAARRGKHVICEKPVALTLGQADRMVAAVEEAGVIAMVAHVIRFWPQYVAIRTLFERGDLGRGLIATASRLAEPPGWSDWFENPVMSGGALLDLHVHDLDFVYSLFGRPAAVHAVGVSAETGGWDHVVTSLDWGDKKAVVEASYLMPKGFPFQMAFRLLGTEACVEYRFRVQGQVEQRAEAETELCLYRPGRPVEHPAYAQTDPYAAELGYFVSCVAQGRQPEVASLEQARTVLEIALAARRSLETGQVVDL